MLAWAKFGRCEASARKPHVSAVYTAAGHREGSHLVQHVHNSLYTASNRASKSTSMHPETSAVSSLSFAHPRRVQIIAEIVITASDKGTLSMFKLRTVSQHTEYAEAISMFKIRVALRRSAFDTPKVRSRLPSMPKTHLRPRRQRTKTAEDPQIHQPIVFGDGGGRESEREREREKKNRERERKRERERERERRRESPPSKDINFIRLLRACGVDTWASPGSFCKHAQQKSAPPKHRPNACASLRSDVPPRVHKVAVARNNREKNWLGQSKRPDLSPALRPCFWERTDSCAAHICTFFARDSRAPGRASLQRSPWR